MTREIIAGTSQHCIYAPQRKFLVKDDP